MSTTQLDDSIADLDDAIQSFKTNPSAATLDDVYRATTAIESACKNQLKTCLEN